MSLRQKLGFFFVTEADDREKALNMYRSGSAPPTVEGSLSAVGGLLNKNGFMSEEKLRSDPAYLSYYYTNVNLNPRLPQPLLSGEDERFSQRLQGGGSSAIGDRRKVNKNDSRSNGWRSPFAMPQGFNNSKKAESENEMGKLQVPVEWGGDGLISLPGLGLCS
ncbi:pumilio homolog 1-like [Lycium ferocissimum]|uniref:pumilio homolog 1-like n=1 Tax=Lycium ferocissimum TaxID=112874 RepID=UPI0028157299|nr:pumilio homolog 1-like [Lycium ferocissimum]